MKKSYTATHLMVLFDHDGRILAGIPVHDGYAGPVPVAGKGHEVARFDLSEGDRGRQAHEIDVVRLCTTQKVDTHRRVLTTREKSAS
jgi:hypothetical protein